jgi:CRP-like cAMP-binding protein
LHVSPADKDFDMAMDSTSCHTMASPKGRLAQVWHMMAGRKRPVPQPVPACDRRGVLLDIARTWPKPARAITEEFKDVTDEDISELRKLLYRVGRPMTNQEIADRLGVSKGHASRQVTRLVRAGFLMRRKSGRTVAIYLH